MPTFTLHTNVAKDQIPSGFLKETSRLVAKTLGKPESYVVVHVVPDQLMIWGGSDAPCGSARIMSIGCLGVAPNKKHSAAISDHIKKHLGISEDRLYIEFSDVDKTNMGYSGTTFHDLL